MTIHLETYSHRKRMGHPAEIQLRSILQHAWAEIEHDLGYKTIHAIPKVMRRRFSRLAGLLELADAEFTSIRDSLADYRATMADQIASHALTTSIDLTSIAVFINRNDDVNAMHHFIRENGGKVTMKPSAEFLNALVKGLMAVGIQTIGQLASGIGTHRMIVEQYSLCVYRGSFKGVGFFPGAPLLTFCEYLAISQGGREGLQEWREQMKPGYSTPVDQCLSCFYKVKTTRPYNSR